MFFKCWGAINCRALWPQIESQTCPEFDWWLCYILTLCTIATYSDETFFLKFNIRLQIFLSPFYLIQSIHQSFWYLFRISIFCFRPLRCRWWNGFFPYHPPTIVSHRMICLWLIIKRAKPPRIYKLTYTQVPRSCYIII